MDKKKGNDIIEHYEAEIDSLLQAGVLQECKDWQRYNEGIELEWESLERGLDHAAEGLADILNTL